MSRRWAVSGYRPDVAALAAAPTRIVIAVGEESAGTFTARTSEAAAALRGQQATVFPATTAASSAASTATPASPRPSPANSARSSKADEYSRRGPARGVRIASSVATPRGSSRA